MYFQNPTTANRLKGRIYVGLIFLAIGLLMGRLITPSQAQVPQLRVRAMLWGKTEVRFFVTPQNEYSPRTQTLDESSLKATVAGKPVRLKSISRVRKSRGGVALVLCMDTSGSMKGAPISAARKAAINFVRQTRTGDHIALVNFNDDYRIVRDFTSDHDVLVKDIMGIQATNGDTRIYDTIKGASVLHKDPSDEQMIILLLTDGTDNRSNFRLDAIIESMQRRAIAVYAIALGKNADIQGLKALTSGTGGILAQGRRPEELKLLYSGLQKKLYDSYVMSADLPPDVAKKVEEGGSGTVPVTLQWSFEGGATFTASGSFAPEVNPEATATPQPQPLPTQDPRPADSSGEDLARLLLISIGAGGSVYATRRVIRQTVRIRAIREGRANDEVKPPPSHETESIVSGVVTETSYAVHGNIVIGAPKDHGFHDPNGSRLEMPAPSPVHWSTMVRDKKLPTPAAWLQGIRGPHQGRHLDLRDGAQIGRGENCEIRLDDDQNVSRHHAKVNADKDGRFTITDMASTNGVFVNHERVYQAMLRDGDEVRLGDSVFVYKAVTMESGSGQASGFGSNAPVLPDPSSRELLPKGNSPFASSVPPLTPLSGRQEELP